MNKINGLQEYIIVQQCESQLSISIMDQTYYQSSNDDDTGHLIWNCCIAWHGSKLFSFLHNEELK